MIFLTRNEILDQLKKLGIYTPSELQIYSRDYMVYFTEEYLTQN
jgi:hypothetical protein